MTEIVAGMSDAFTLVGTIVTQMTTQPILLFCLSASLIPIGISIFKKLKRAAR